MPANIFLLDNRMIKHKSLPFYEVNNILNYDIRRKSNPNKVQLYYRELNVLKPVMQGGNLWDSIKKGAKKIKNFFKKGMDFVDNSAVLKGFKDSALDYIGQKTGVDAHKIYDTAHQVVDALPEWSDTPDPNTDPVDYFNYRQQQYATTPSTQTYSSYPQGYYTQPTQSYPNYQQSYQQGYQTSYPNYQGYQQSYPQTQTQTQTVPNQPGRNSQNTVSNQLTNAYNQINKMPTTTGQRGRARANLSAISSGFKSCGEDINTALSRNKTIMNNIPKLLMMGMNASGQLTIQKDFKPILEKFGLKTLTVPKAIKDMVSKYRIAIAPHTIASNEGKGPYVGSNQARVQTTTGSNKLESTTNNGTNKVNPDKADGHGRLNLGSGDESKGRLNLGRGNEVGGKSSRYADIIAKLKHK